MRNLELLLFAAISVVSLSCSEKQPQPVEESKPLELESYWSATAVWLNNVNRIRITSGNGDYTLIYPKSVTGAYEDVPYPDYLESILSIKIDEANNIVIEFKTDDSRVHDLFMVKDAKNERRVFGVHYIPGPDKLIGGFNPTWEEDPSDPGEDYWVNY